MKKKSLILFLTIILLTLFIIDFKLCNSEPKTVPQIKSGKALTFFVATDPHYLSKNLTDNGEAFNTFMNSGDGKQLNYIDAILNAFTRDVKRLKPNFLIISGDLTNNGEKNSHIELAKKLKAIEKSGTSVFLIPGNHDIYNPYARAFKGDKQYLTDTVSDKDFSKIYGNFGYNEAISKDKNTLSYLAAPSKDVWLLMLDANKYKDNMMLGFPDSAGFITKDTFEWIKKCSLLAKQKKARIITVMHQNLVDHVEGITQGYTIDNSAEALKVFQDCGLNLVLSGHIHIQDIKCNKSGKIPIYDIVTSAISVYPQQYGVIKYSPKDGFDYSTSKVDVEGWANASKLSDKNLLNFQKYSKSFFEIQSYNKAYNRLSQTNGLTENEKKLMAETMSSLNLKQFSGTMNKNMNEIINSQGYKLLVASNSKFLKHYGISIANNVINNNKLHISNQIK